MSDDLHLRLVGDCLQVGMEDTSFGIHCLAVAVLGGGRIESAGEEVLRFRGEVVLVLDNDDQVFI
jgi:hypothetical protein